MPVGLNVVLKIFAVSFRTATTVNMRAGEREGRAGEPGGIGAGGRAGLMPLFLLWGWLLVGWLVGLVGSAMRLC